MIQVDSPTHVYFKWAEPQFFLLRFEIDRFGGDGVAVRLKQERHLLHSRPR